MFHRTDFPMFVGFFLIISQLYNPLGRHCAQITTAFIVLGYKLNMYFDCICNLMNLNINGFCHFCHMFRVTGGHFYVYCSGNEYCLGFSGIDQIWGRILRLKSATGNITLVGFECILYLVEEWAPILHCIHSIYNNYNMDLDDLLTFESINDFSCLYYSS